MLSENTQYQGIVSKLRTLHGELLKLEQSGLDQAVRENPALIGQYLTSLRLNCNLLFSFQNKYIDVLNERIRETATKRQELYIEQLTTMKKSPNAADSLASNMTRVDEAEVKVLMNIIQQIKNEYERYNGICISLQSRMKEFDTERRMG